MDIRAYIVNAFTTEIGGGNPAGVVLSDNELSENMMQKIAFDINKPVTAFIKRDKNSYAIRWFTPVKEDPLCGHGTLAASKILFDMGEKLPLEFIYKDGKITADKEHGEIISISFNEDDYESSKIENAYYEFFGINDIIQCIYGKRTKKVIVIVNRNVSLHDISPHYGKMLGHKGLCANGIAVTKESGKPEEYDFESRYFNPWYGVNEDFVTGSVHTVLSRYWGEKLNKDEMTAYQASERPGVIKISRISGQVKLKGNARVVIKGSFIL